MDENFIPVRNESDLHITIHITPSNESYGGSYDKEITIKHRPMIKGMNRTIDYTYEPLPKPLEVLPAIIPPKKTGYMMFPNDQPLTQSQNTNQDQQQDKNNEVFNLMSDQPNDQPKTQPQTNNSEIQDQDKNNKEVFTENDPSLLTHPSPLEVDHTDTPLTNTT
jgi:hypothetical protein